MRNPNYSPKKMKVLAMTIASTFIFLGHILLIGR